MPNFGGPHLERPSTVKGRRDAERRARKVAKLEAKERQLEEEAALKEVQKALRQQAADLAPQCIDILHDIMLNGEHMPSRVRAAALILERVVSPLSRPKPVAPPPDAPEEESGPDFAQQADALIRTLTPEQIKQLAALTKA